MPRNRQSSDGIFRVQKRSLRGTMAGLVTAMVGMSLLAPAASAAPLRMDNSTAEQDAAAQGGAWYEDFLGLDAVHQVTTGKGVKVAVIDGTINTHQPEFDGASVEVYPKSFCSIDIDNNLTNPEIGGPNGGGALHGTLTSLFVVGNGVGADGVQSIKGVAPGIDFYFYPVGGFNDMDVCGTFGGVNEAAAVDQAVADGVDVISFSLGIGETPRAIDENVGTQLKRSRLES